MMSRYPFFRNASRVGSTPDRLTRRLGRHVRRASSLLLAVVLTGCGGQVITHTTPTPASIAVILPTSTSPAGTAEPLRLTPVPTNTPAPSPTPVVHIVQPGDTLLGIALQYGVTLDALQQINGVLRPETLQIGQQIVIPRPQPGSIVNEGGDTGVFLFPTPTALPVTVEGAARYITPVGSQWVLGEVVNPNDSALENVEVRVSLMDNQGVEITSRIVYTALEAVPARGRAPFGVLFEEPPADAVAFNVIVIRAEPSYNHDRRYATLQIVNPQPEQRGTAYGLTATVSNVGATNAGTVQVVMTVYDQQRRVTGFRRITVADGLAPGGSASFDLIVGPDPSAPDVADYIAVAEARVP